MTAFNNYSLIKKLQSSLCLLYECCEALRICDSDIGKNLSVELYTRLLKTIHES